MTHKQAALIVAALLAAFVASGWRTAADAMRDEEVRHRLRAMDREALTLEQRVNEIDLRVKTLEARP